MFTLTLTTHSPRGLTRSFSSPFIWNKSRFQNEMKAFFWIYKFITRHVFFKCSTPFPANNWARAWRKWVHSIERMKEWKNPTVKRRRNFHLCGYFLLFFSPFLGRGKIETKIHDQELACPAGGVCGRGGSNRGASWEIFKVDWQLRK